MGGDVAYIEEKGLIRGRVVEELERVIGDECALVSLQLQGLAVEVIGVGAVMDTLPAGEAEGPVEAGRRTVRTAHVPFP